MPFSSFRQYLHVNRTVFIGLTIFILAFIVRISYFGVLGIQPAGDTHFYLKNSSIVQEAGGNVLALREASVPIYYWGYSSLLALFQNNEPLVVVMQIVLHAVAAFLMYKIGERLFGTVTGVIVGIGFALLWEVFHWNLYILTDSVFIFVLIASLCAYLKAKDTGQRWRWALFGILVFSTVFLRPAFVPFLASVGLLLTAHWNRKLRWSLIAAGGVVAVGSIIYFLQQAPDVRHGISGFLHFFVSLYEDGVIVRSRYETDGSPLWVFVRRLIAFWYIYAGTYSTAHIILNIATFVPLFVFGILGLVKSYSHGMTPVHYFILNTIILYWVFHSATNLDYDWRYRLTTLPFLLLFASFGVATLYTSIMKSIPKSHTS